MSLLEQLRAKAFHHASSSDANQAIDTVRAQVEAESGQPAFSYELFEPRLSADAVWLTQAVPKFVRFLHDRGVRSARAPGVFVSLFAGDGLFFVTATDALELFAAAKSARVEDLFRWYADGGTGEPLRLGPG